MDATNILDLYLPEMLRYSVFPRHTHPEPRACMGEPQTLAGGIVARIDERISTFLLVNAYFKVFNTPQGAS